ncbi:MAG: hypothetical protein QOF82_1371 [Frankiales bacterium]|jgi:hypothetical protein|nr:hypothetical protein [Frankiales bacterium]MDX6212284.1 hypothetical protein [Frankiales bacterium]MDX6223407.1 hypothetical protein [Frankiales bacterium]
MQLAASEIAILHREITEAEGLLAAGRDTADPLESLVQLTSALDVLTATQHELVNVLLDRGATWSQVAVALSMSNAGARRRFPRRESRTATSTD